MLNTESTVNRWIRRDLKKKAKRKFTPDNRKSVRYSMKRMLQKAKELTS